MADTSTQTGTPGLRRSVGLGAATGSGVAIIVGAGVYVLMGAAAPHSGNALWLSFILAGAAALFTGLSYAELSSMYPRAAAGYNYARQAFGEGPAFTVGWLTLFSQVVSISTVALGFGAYFQDKLGFSDVGAGMLLTAACAAVAYRGVSESTALGSILSLLEVGGLVVIIWAGVSHLGDVDLLERPEGMAGVFRGASLLFFAFLGFEQLADLAQEIKNPRRNLPIAILLSGGISAALYIVAAVAAVSVVGWRAVAASHAPLADVARAAYGQQGTHVLTAIALVSTASTALIMVVAAARTVFGMAAGGSFPRWLGAVHARRQTPWVATVAVAAAALLGILSGDIGFVAQITNVSILIVFFAVNLALIALRRKEPAQARPFRVPGRIGGVPIAAMLGMATCALLIATAGLVPILVGAGIAAGAMLLYVLKRRREGRGARRV